MIMKYKKCLILLLLVILFIILQQRKESFINYISVYDGDKSYMNFIDYIHSFYKGPSYKRKGLLVTDLRGDPHFLNRYSDPYVMNPRFQNFKGFFWGMPHNRKIIRI